LTIYNLDCMKPLSSRSNIIISEDFTESLLIRIINLVDQLYYPAEHMVSTSQSSQRITSPINTPFFRSIIIFKIASIYNNLDNSKYNIGTCTSFIQVGKQNYEYNIVLITKSVYQVILKNIPNLTTHSVESVKNIISASFGFIFHFFQ